MKPERPHLLPRLLFITPVMPAAGGNGLAMRQGQFLTAYQPDFDIDLAVIPVAGPARADDKFARRLVHDLKIFPADNIDTHFSLLMRLKNPEDRLTAFMAYGWPSITARLTATLRNDVAAWAERRRYQLVHVGRLYMLAAAPSVSTPLVVDADEDDARVFRRLAFLAEQDTHIFEARWARQEADYSEQMAAKLLGRACHIFTACKADAISLEQPNRTISVVPNVISRPRFKPQPRCRRVLFVGTLGYRPNEQALIWFIKNCWPKLRKNMPALRLDIVGTGPSATLRRLMRQPGITGHGWQKNIHRFYAQSGAVIVPIQAGGGSRIKLLEAASFGCAIIATKAGAEGADLQPDRDFIQADGALRFVRAVVRALHKPLHNGRAARRAVERGHDPERWQARIRAIARLIAV